MPVHARLEFLSAASQPPYSIRGASVVIGRGGHCDIQVADSRVSNEQLRITGNEGSYKALVLGKTNPTWVAGQAIPPGQEWPLVDGDHISVLWNVGAVPRGEELFAAFSFHVESPRIGDEDAVMGVRSQSQVTTQAATQLQAEPHDEAKRSLESMRHARGTGRDDCHTGRPVYAYRSRNQRICAPSFQLLHQRCCANALHLQ